MEVLVLTVDTMHPTGAEQSLPSFWLALHSCMQPLLVCITFEHEICSANSRIEILVDTVDVVLSSIDIDEKFLGMTLFALVPNTTEFLVSDFLTSACVVLC